MGGTTRHLLESIRRAKLRTDPRLASYELPRWPRSARRRTRIGIVGGGISGLIVAHLLCELGFQVSLFEAQGRVGGRIRTDRLPGAEAFPVEFGAARISDSHRHTFYWLNRMKLTPAPVYPYTGGLVRLDGGQRRVGVNTSLLSANQVHQLVNGQHWESQFQSTAQTLLSLSRDALLKPNWYRVVGGVAQLPLALAANLSGVVQLRRPVDGVDSRGGKVVLRYQQDTTPARAEFDRVVFAAPFSTLRDIEFTPELSPGKRQVIRDARQESALRVAATVSPGSWRDSRLCGWGCTAEGIEVWHPYRMRKEQTSVFVGYAQKTAARQFVNLSRTDREQRFAELLSRMFPGIQPHIQNMTSHCWDEDRWANGAQSIRDYDAATGRAIRMPEGPLHFCGEHTTDGGWMDGAISSAYRVVSEVCCNQARQDHKSSRASADPSGNHSVA